MTTPTWPSILDGSRENDGCPVPPEMLAAIGEIVESASRYPLRWRMHMGRVRTGEPFVGKPGEYCCPVGAAWRSGRLPLPEEDVVFAMPGLQNVDQWPHPWGRAGRIVIQAADGFIETRHDGIQRRTQRLLRERLVERQVLPELLPRLP